MDGINVNQIKEALLARREAIDGILERERGLGLEQGGEHQAEIIDIAQALEQIEREKSIADQERRELLAIERALAKIATGAFGTCEDCDEAIAPKRLLVLPEARLCARCQQIEERHQSRTARGITAAAR